MFDRIRNLISSIENVETKFYGPTGETVVLEGTWRRIQVEAQAIRAELDALVLQAVAMVAAQKPVEEEALAEVAEIGGPTEPPKQIDDAIAQAAEG